MSLSDSVAPLLKTRCAQMNGLPCCTVNQSPGSSSGESSTGHGRLRI